MTATDVAPVRVDAAYRALRVPFRTTVKMRWYARADRLSGLPTGLSPETTPILQQLRATFGDVAERERTRFFMAIGPASVRLAQVSREIELARYELARRTRAVNELAVSSPEEWLTLRYPGEERLEASAIRSRRETSHRHAADAARAAQRESQTTLDNSLVEQAQLRREVQARAEQAVGRVLRFGWLTEATAAVYRRALIRRHPERDALIHHWTTEICVAPAWVAAAELAASVERSGVTE